MQIASKPDFKFAVVMASHLSDYRGAAKDRVNKFHRAVESFVSQSCKDAQLFIVADGCMTTMAEVRKYTHRTFNSGRIDCRLIEKQPLFSGKVRNFGIHHSRGEYVLYLDTDDYFGKDHLTTILNGLHGQDWVYFDDYVYQKQAGKFRTRLCNLARKFNYGTSNICHRKLPGLYWRNSGYEHDYHFVNDLKMKSTNHSYIGQAQYYVCHIPQRYDI